MARRYKKELGSERPFADLTGPEAVASLKGRAKDEVTRPTMDETVEARAKERAPSVANEQAERAYVAGQGPRPATFTPQLGDAARMAAENRRMAAGTADINARVDAVRAGRTTPNWAGYLQSRGISDDKIRAVRALNGQPNAPTTPPPVGPRMDPAKAAELMRGRDAWQTRYGTSPTNKPGYNPIGGTVAVSDAQRSDPAYQARVSSAGQAAQEYQARQARLNEIRQQVQMQKAAEAEMNRGRGIQARAAQARDLRMDKIATAGLSPEDRASVLLDRREMETGERVNRYNAETASAERAADRASEERIAKTRASAPAGNRGDAEDRARKARLADSDRQAKSIGLRIEDIDGQMEAMTKAGGNDSPEFDALKMERDDLRKVQSAFVGGAPLFKGGDFNQWVEENGLVPGDRIVQRDPETGRLVVGKIKTAP